MADIIAMKLSFAVTSSVVICCMLVRSKFTPHRRLDGFIFDGLSPLVTNDQQLEKTFSLAAGIFSLISGLVLVALPDAVNHKIMSAMWNNAYFGLIGAFSPNVIDLGSAHPIA